ncbi:uncharacterized protein H6S33_001419 [Morchella sextelata]|uniref:uncharacterized protein n=1 Tax=Morchella sextelata TaxID=1174677 RepID=UPI001D0558FF|nr:uncharacterized protein H6S33_001419 [Morchella sextelata]KAH0609191.1 hypothetical protein H6S33_001419 [Morchella sextelata]
MSDSSLWVTLYHTGFLAPSSLALYQVMAASLFKSDAIPTLIIRCSIKSHPPSPSHLFPFPRNKTIQLSP